MRETTQLNIVPLVDLHYDICEGKHPTMHYMLTHHRAQFLPRFQDVLLKHYSNIPASEASILQVDRELTCLLLHIYQVIYSKSGQALSALQTQAPPLPNILQNQVICDDYMDINFCSQQPASNVVLDYIMTIISLREEYKRSLNLTSTSR